MRLYAKNKEPQLRQITFNLQPKKKNIFISNSSQLRESSEINLFVVFFHLSRLLQNYFQFFYFHKIQNIE